MLRPDPTRLALLAAALWLAAAAPARADSPFGLEFFGVDTRMGDAAMEGRGGAGLAYTDSLNPNVLTPTQLVDVVRVSIGLASSFESRSSDNGNNQVERNLLRTPSLRLAAPLGRRAGFGIGWQANRATQWTVVRPYAGPDTSANAQASTERIEREGTRFSIPIELGYTLGDHFRLGGGVLLERGTIRLRYAIELPGNDVDPEETREDSYSGTAFKLAAAVHDIAGVSMAGWYVPQYDADVNVSQRGRALSAREDGSRTDTMPARWGVGARVAFGDGWNVGADLEGEQWSQYEGRDFATQAAAGAELRDEIEWRVGLEREDSREAGRERQAWRVGVHGRRWHYTLQDSPVDEWGVTVGTNVPFNNPWAQADIALGWSRIGSVDDNGLSEDVFRIVFSLAGGERWY